MGLQAASIAFPPYPSIRLRNSKTSGGNGRLDADKEHSGVIGLTRSYGKYLASDEDITFNSVCPNVVKTNISTGAFYDKMEKANLICDMEGLMLAFEACMGASKLTAQILEVTAAKVAFTHREEMEPLDDTVVKGFELLVPRCHHMQTP